MDGHITSRKTYFIVFLMLLGLLGMSVVAATYDLGNMNIVVAIGISVGKATLIILFFMHVLHSSNVIRLAAIGGVVWLGIMLVLTLADYETRAEWSELPELPAVVDVERTAGHHGPNNADKMSRAGDEMSYHAATPAGRAGVQ